MTAGALHPGAIRRPGTADGLAPQFLSGNRIDVSAIARTSVARSPAAL
jgi:hypothetical protein